MGEVVRFPFLLVVTLGSRIVGRVGSIPTILRFVGFAASIACERIACTVVCMTVVFTSLMLLVSFHFSAFSVEMAKFIAIETIPLFGVVGVIFYWFCFTCRLNWVYFVSGDESHLICRSKAIEFHFPF